MKKTHLLFGFGLMAMVLPACSSEKPIAPTAPPENIVTVPSDELECESAGRRDDQGRPIPLC